LGGLLVGPLGPPARGLAQSLLESSGWEHLAAVLPSPLPTATGLVLVALLASATATDLRRFRIPNALTYPALGLAVLTNALSEVAPPNIRALLGSVGLAECLAGVGLAFGVFALLFRWRICGGGDVKLATAVGGLLGPLGALNGLVYTAMIGGAVAAVFVLGGAVSGRGGPSTKAILPIAPLFAVGVLASLFLDGVAHATT
jgi:prepilin peptidase CpaA